MQTIPYTVATLGIFLALGGCVATPDVNAQIQQANTMAANAQANAAQMIQAAQAASIGQVSGNLHVNSANFPVMRCGSGQASGFSGVDVFGSDGSRIRFVAETDGTSSVIYFAPNGGAAGTTMKGCSTLNVRPTGAVLNGVPFMGGNAKFDCKADALHVDGFIAFQCG